VVTPDIERVEDAGRLPSVSDMPDRGNVDASDVERVSDVPSAFTPPALTPSAAGAGSPANSGENTAPRSPSPILPEGWEERQDANGRTFYVNHTERTTQWVHPLSGARNQPSTNSSSSEFNQRHHISVDDDNNCMEDDQHGAGGSSTVAADTDSVVDSLARRSASQTNGTKRTSTNRQVSSIEEDGGGPLPEGWSMKRAPNGRKFFINHKDQSTTWTDPRTGQPSEQVGDKATNGARRKTSAKSPSSRVGKHENGLGPLPAGWEERVHTDGRIFFIDHNKKRTTWEDPRLSDPNVNGPAVPYSRDYKRKYDYFKGQLRRPQGIPKQFKLRVRRRHIFEDSFQQVLVPRAKADVLKASLWVEFDGESGLDYGGLAREWFFLLSKEMFNPYYGFFEYSAIDNYTLQINPYSKALTDGDHLK